MARLSARSRSRAGSALNSASTRTTRPDDLKRLDLSAPSVPLSAFVGRKAEIGHLTKLLETSRLVTLTGPGGCGKTRLAMEVANRAAPRLRHGAAFVDLGPIREPAKVAESVAAAVRPGGCGLNEALALLGEAELLVLIDNAEHVVDAVGVAAGGVLAACPNVHLLVTSRESLNVGGEVVWSVQALQLPPCEWDLDSRSLLVNDAVNLFVTRAAEHENGFRLTEENARLVVGICRRLDGLPLALELAAARITSLGLREILARLDDCFTLLTGGARNAVPRHQTLRATVDWSYQLLDDSERRLLAELSVFVGAFTLDAVEAICSAPDPPGVGLADLLHRLVNKSLVVRHPQPNGGLRYGLIDVIRQFGLQRLVENGDGLVRSQHAAYYAQLTRALSLDGSGLGDSVHSMRAEYDNVYQALRWAIKEDPSLEADLVFHLRWFWRLRGLFDEARERTMSVLAQDYVSGVRRAHLHVDAAGWYRRTGEIAMAMTQLDHAAFLAADIQDPQLSGRICLSRGILQAATGDVGGAQRQFSEGIAALASSSPGYTLAGLFNNLAMVQVDLGHADEAAVNAERALELMRLASEDAYWLPSVLHTLGAALLAANRLAGARDRFLESLRGAVEGGNVPMSIAALNGLASVAAQQNNAKLCLELLAAARACADKFMAESLGEAPTPDDDAERASRAALGDMTAEAAWARGIRMNLQQALENAASEEGTPVDTALTARKTQIVRLVAAGLGNKEIARKLVISERTVEAHLDQVRHQLGLRNRAQIAIWAVTRGIA